MPHWSRRRFLQASAAMGAAYGLGIGRAGAAVPMEMDGSNFMLAAPEANAKKGGVLRYGITMRPPHLDFHQSGHANAGLGVAAKAKFSVSTSPAAR